MRDWFNYPLIFCILFLFSCERDEPLPLDLGLPSYPSQTVVFEEVQLTTVKDDAVRTDNLNFHLVGKINDPFFGISQASTYSQIGLLGGIDIPPNAVLDSVVLRVKSVGYYGDRQAKADYEVYLLEEAILRDFTYMNNSITQLGNKLGQLSQINLAASARDLVVRIDKLWSDYDYFVGKSYQSSSSFQEAVKGIAIVCTSDYESGDGQIISLNFNDNRSGITAYYHTFEAQDGQLVEIGSSVQFQMLSEVKTYSQVIHSLDGSPAEEFLNEANGTDDIAFTKALGVSSINVSIPQIKQLSDSGALAFHKVELYLPIDSSLSSDIFPPVDFLDLKIRNSQGQLVNVADAVRPYYDRQYNYGSQAYIFNLTSHIQGLLNEYRNNPDFKDNGFVLSVVKNDPFAFSVGRTILRNGKAFTTNGEGAHLKIYYSNIDGL